MANALDDLPLVLDADEVARVLRISRWQVYQAAGRGEIRALRVGRCMRFPRAEIARLLGVSDVAEATVAAGARRPEISPDDLRV